MLGKKDSTKRFGGSYCINVVIVIAFVARTTRRNLHTQLIENCYYRFQRIPKEADVLLTRFSYDAHCTYNMPKTQLLFIYRFYYYCCLCVILYSFYISIVRNGCCNKEKKKRKKEKKKTYAKKLTTPTKSLDTAVKKANFFLTSFLRNETKIVCCAS